MKPAKAKPCLLCGTMGGSVQLGRAAPRRVRGLCNACLRIDGRPERRTAPRERREADPTLFEIRARAQVERNKARGLARARFRLMECGPPVRIITYRKAPMGYAYLFEDNPR